MSNRRKRTPLAHLVPSVVLMRAEGRTLDEIGARLALTKQRISQVVKAAKKFEDVSAQWGFPFSNRTHRILDALAIQSKEDALALYRTGHTCTRVPCGHSAASRTTRYASGSESSR